MRVIRSYQMINYLGVQVMYSVWGGGQGGSFQTPGIKEGMFVFGFFLDGKMSKFLLLWECLEIMQRQLSPGINSKVGVDEVTDQSSCLNQKVFIKMMALQILQIMNYALMNQGHLQHHL